MRKSILILFLVLSFHGGVWAFDMPNNFSPDVAHTWTAAQTFTAGVTVYGTGGVSPFVVSDSGVTAQGLTINSPHPVYSSQHVIKEYDNGVLRHYLQGNGQAVWQIASGTTEQGKIIYSTGPQIIMTYYDMPTNTWPNSKRFNIRNYDTYINFSWNDIVNEGLKIGYHGVGLGISSFSPFMNHLEFGTGTSGIPVGPGFVAYADTTSGATKIHAYDLTGTFAALSSFNENGKAERTEVNIFAGIKAVWNDDGTVTYSQVPKVNPEAEHRKIWIANWKQNNQVNEQVPEVEAWEIITTSEDATAKVGEEDRFIPDPETRSVKKVKVDKMVPIKIWRNETRLRDGIFIDSNSGKFLRKSFPTQAQAEAAADKDFCFDWGTMPKFVRQAWGKD